MSAMVDIARNHDGITPTAAGPTMPPTTPLAVAVPGSAARRTVDGRSYGDVGAPHNGRESSAALPAAESRSAVAARYLLAGIRIALGWVFLWAFLDKLFGWGFATPSARSWLNGGSPTAGFLGGSEGPFSGFFTAIAGNTVTNVLFMGALLAIGAALILGIGMRLAAIGGAILVVMMWAAVLPPSSNPFMDDHLVYAAILIVLTLLGAGNTLGFGKAWSATPLVRNATWLR
ncbi:DoxX family protein [Micromonospora sp. NPDC049204]|uniref:DoxX family protein n=1 Tax=Micromonospora sp. NPDC049204 TaxID=3154351 RepID=UPI0033CF9E1E